MKNYLIPITLLASSLAIQSPAVQAATVSLTDSTRCGAGNASHNISLSDVSGNSGGSSECWGTFDGNDPGPSGDGFSIGSSTYDFITKLDTGIPSVLTGTNIGLSLTPDNGTASSGTWSYDSSLFNPVEFLIVLKAASKPGFAVWLFDGTDADSDSGLWNVAWGNSLSHFGIYASNTPPTSGDCSDPDYQVLHTDECGSGDIPEPSIALLLIPGLLGMMSVSNRRRNKK